MATTIDTAAGEVVVQVTGAPCEVKVDGFSSYYNVPVRMTIGHQWANGAVSMKNDGHPIGQSRDAWVSGGVLSLIEELPDYDQGIVLAELAASAGSIVEGHVAA